MKCRVHTARRRVPELGQQEACVPALIAHATGRSIAGYCGRSPKHGFNGASAITWMLVCSTVLSASGVRKLADVCLVWGWRLGTKEKSWRQTSEETNKERGMHDTFAANFLDIAFHRPIPQALRFLLRFQSQKATTTIVRIMLLKSAQQRTSQGQQRSSKHGRHGLCP